MFICDRPSGDRVDYEPEWKDILIDLYNKQPDKLPTPNMLRFMRKETGLDLHEIKKVITKYIEETYNYHF